jgi:hypothetical protein
MARLQYKDWVGKQARVLRALTNKANTLTFERKTIVLISGYDTYQQFSITNIHGDRESWMWGIKPYKLKLLDGSDETIGQKILAYLIQANAFEERWVGAPDIARAISESLPSVASQLTLMANDDTLDRRRGEGRRGGYGYRPTSQYLRVMSRYDKLVSDHDIC